VAQQNPNTITLDDMYQIATNAQREAGSKTSKTVAAVCNDKNDNSDEEEVPAFQRRNSAKTRTRRRSCKTFCHRPRTFTQGMNNSNQNRKYCFYCKLQNHTQEDCFKRIHEKKPCRDKQGHAYWPKVYMTSNNDQNERDQQGQKHNSLGPT